CHGEDGASEGGFNFVLNLEKLARTVVKPKNLAGSLLWERISATDESVMPPEGEKPRPTPEEIALVKAWIEAGAPALPTAKPREFIPNEQVVKWVYADVQKAAERSRRFQRYFTLTHLYNAGVSEDELQTYRNAFFKLINSLSWNTDLVLPEALDPAKTVFRIDIRQLNWSGEQWQQVESANPYFLALNSAEALACNTATQSNMPYVRIDWFVFAASKPPLYHAMLALPETAAELEAVLHVNAEANIEQEKAIRAGFNRSGVSQHNRLIEWHKSPYGSYWKSYDFGGSTGRQNLFEYPLGSGGSSADSFQHDGGELIFSLPNGMQGYMLVDGSGRRIEQGPTNIVSDPKQPDRLVTNGVSCMSCHYTGVIPKTDEVGKAVRANPKAFENAEDILALYREPEHLNRVLDEDARRFAAAMKKLGMTSLSRSGEAVSAMALRFQQELDLPLAACEFGVTPDDLLKRLDGTAVSARRFAPLRVPGGTIKRDVFVAGFGEAALELRLTSESRSGAGIPNNGPTPAIASTAPRPAVASPPASSAAMARLPNTADGKPGELRRFTDLRWGAKSLAFSFDGSLLAAGKPDREVKLFDVVKNAEIGSNDKLDLLASVEYCAFTPFGLNLLLAGRSGQIQIFQVSRNGQFKETGQFVGHSQQVNCLSLSADGKFAVSGSQEKKLRYWEVSSGREHGVFAGFEGGVKACHLARNGRTALATDGQTLLTIDCAKRTVTASRKLTNSWASGQAAAFSADGELVAIGDSYAIRVWNLTTGAELPVLQDNEIQWSMVFTPDGTRLISGGSGKVNVWDPRKGRKLSVISGGQGYIKALAASPDNKHAAAAVNSDSDVIVVRLPPPEK
ncbi:MAG TPA: c-type cytochrome domain-containing protein, partial [Pirellulaceae bacterium]|nr:c-type cytochrome domain-containing protein [Pirellulaceae bacterium]